VARNAAADALLAATSPIRTSLLMAQTELALARGDLLAARESLDQAEALKAQTGAEGGIGSTLATRARLEAATGNRREAKDLLEQARDRLEDLAAVDAWRTAAAAIGEPNSSVRLAPPTPDPLRDRAFAAVRVLPYWVSELQRGIPIAISVGIAFGILWFALRIHDRIPGGWLTLAVAYAVLVVLLIASAVRNRLPRRR